MVRIRQDTARLRRHWDRQAPQYNRRMTTAERFFGDTRSWLCGRAVGETLEVAVGTGLNFPHYPPEVQLTGVDLSPGMLQQARNRTDGPTSLTLTTGDAGELDFPAESFDTVVSTFALCGVPDDRLVVEQFGSVLRPGGLLLVADHVVSTVLPVRLLQSVVELVSVPFGNETLRRRPIEHVLASGFMIEQHERFRLGVIERFVARKPA